MASVKDGRPKCPTCQAMTADGKFDHWRSLEPLKLLAEFSNPAAAARAAKLRKKNG